MKIVVVKKSESNINIGKNVIGVDIPECRKGELHFFFVECIFKENKPKSLHV